MHYLISYFLSPRPRFLLIVVPLLFSSLALAELPSEAMEEVIVTAEFRDTGLQKTAKSVTVISEERFKARGATHLEESLNMIPNLNFAGGTSRARFFQIRGIGERSQFIEPVNPSVGILIDDIDFTGAGSIATLFDVEQIEVLKGPQGTRYGANSLAGLINIKTKDPTDHLEASVHAGVADFESKTWGATLSGPISDSAAYRLAAQKSVSNGYTSNSYLNREDTNDRDELTLRGKINWSPGDIWSLKASLFKIDFDNGYDAFSLDNTRVTLSDEPGHDKQNSTGLAINNEWNLPAFDLEIITSFSHSDLEYGYDEDWSYTGIHPWGYTSTDNYTRDRKTRSLELRLTSADTSLLFNDTTSWVTGIYSLKSEEELIREYTYLPQTYYSDYNFDTLALYFQLDSRLSDSLELSGGLRIENRKADYRTSDLVDLGLDKTHWGGRFTLKHLTTDTTMSYVTVAKGYKSGGFNTDGTLDPTLRRFGSEELLEMELGIKSMLLDGRLATRLAVFYDDRRDQQVKSSMLVVRPDLSTEFVDFTDNAAEGSNKGLELEMDWNPGNRFSVHTSLALLSAKFDQYINEFGDNLSGREQAHAPKYMYSLGFNYYLDQFQFQLTVDGKDKFYFSDRHGVESTNYALINGSISFNTNNLTILLWGRNLADKDYYVRGFGSFGNDPRKFYITEPYYQFGEPRVVGLNIEYNFY